MIIYKHEDGIYDAWGMFRDSSITNSTMSFNLTVGSLQFPANISPEQPFFRPRTMHAYFQSNLTKWATNPARSLHIFLHLLFRSRSAAAAYASDRVNDACHIGSRLGMKPVRSRLTQ